MDHSEKTDEFDVDDINRTTASLLHAGNAPFSPIFDAPFEEGYHHRYPKS